MVQMRAELMDAGAIDRALMRIAHEIVERDAKAEEFLLIGIKRRGEPIAEQIAANLRRISDVPVLTSAIDISLYRDDLRPVSESPIVKPPTISQNVVKDKVIILVDDVIYTGRTARAAMDALIAIARPAAIRLAILIDRGHRELPIRPDFVGKNIPTSRKEHVEVHFPPVDPEKSVVLSQKM